MRTTGSEAVKITGLTEILTLARSADLSDVKRRARELRDKHYGRTITYSRKLFLPLTNICSNMCLYCNFRRGPTEPGAYIMSPEKALEIVRKYERRYSIKEILICTGERPDAYGVVRDRLSTWGFRNYVDYLEHVLEKILKTTAYAVPHVNVGYLERDEMERIRPYVASLGLMIEVASYRLLRDGPHRYSLTKAPHYRIRFIVNCDRLKIPVTSGTLVGVCENYLDRVRTLLVFSKLSRYVEALQEIIVQPYVPGERSSIMCRCCESPNIEELSTLIALYRLNIATSVSIQSPPNLVDDIVPLLESGINDLGGISPVTPDFINVNYPWPDINHLRRTLNRYGYVLRERLPVYPRFVKNARIWLSDIIREKVSPILDDDGLVDPKYEGKDS